MLEAPANVGGSAACRRLGAAAPRLARV